LVVGLLFFQANCDLALPQYTSRIVDTGIQLGGIDSHIPIVVKEDLFDMLTSFMTAGDKELAKRVYEKKDKDALSDKEYKDLSKKYPALSEKPLYVLKKLSKDDKGKLEDVFLKSYVSFMKVLQQSGTVPGQGLTGPGMDTDGYPDQGLAGAESSSEGTPDFGSIDIDMMAENMQSQAVKMVIKAQYADIGMNTDSMQISYIIRTGLAMLLLAGLVMASAIMVGFLSARLGAGLSKDLRQAVFRKVVSFSNTEFDKFSTASLITRSTNDIQQIQMLVIMSIRIIIYSPILGIGGVIKVLQTNTSMAWIIGLAVLVIMGIVAVLLVVAMPKFRLMQKLVDKLNLVTREILTGLHVIRAFSKEKHEEKRFDLANIDLTKTNLFVNRVMAIMMPVMMLIMNGVTILILWNGGHGIDSGDIQVGDLMAFMQYTMQIIMSFLMMCMMSIMLPRAMVSVGRVSDVLGTDISIKDAKDPLPAREDMKGYVEFDHVSFHYPGAEEDALSDIHFTAEPGQTTAIIGSTGSGKSTLINLIPRFYDVSEGSIRVNGVDVRELDSKELREGIGFVPQKGILFSGTIDSNIRYGRQDASDDDIRRAARIAQAEDFIEEKPEGYGSEIAQGGGNVSGGQKQRLAIARAIAKNPDIYIFDDSFSALDYKTDSLLRKKLKEETGDSTVIIVAQRISTILHADRILVLDDGKLAGIGTHSELMATCEVYRQIASSQLSEEELEAVTRLV